MTPSAPDTWNTLRTQIEFASKPFPSAAVQFATANREEVAPYLIEALSQMALNPAIADDDNYLLHLYAMYLLASWRDVRAYAPLAALGHLSEEKMDLVLGDSVTDGYERCLASVCDGDLLPLQMLFEDTQASHWARMAALEAMKVRVMEGDFAREALIAYLSVQGDAQAARLRLRDTERQEMELLDSIVHVACDIAAVEIQERIDYWFNEKLINSSLLDKSSAQQLLARSFDDLAKHARENGKGYVIDAEQEMGWWEIFAPERIPAPVSTLEVRPAAVSPRPSVQTPVSIPVRTTPKISRNDPCTCGSGKKYKKCCGA
ncbi:MAG: DUF1186 domain-containing protein [Rhodoferax sp.]|nr:DUF1186 domain-containing protein [Rhodoferax sp.]